MKKKVFCLFVIFLLFAMTACVSEKNTEDTQVTESYSQEIEQTVLETGQETSKTSETEENTLSETVCAETSAWETELVTEEITNTETTSNDTIIQNTTTAEATTETETAGQETTEQETATEESTAELCEHIWAAWINKKAATCTEDGYKTRKCRVCGEIEREDTKATGHTAETIPAVEPTCIEEGWTEGEKCSVCHSFLILPERVPKVDHKFVWITDVYPTEEEVGYMHEECTVCREKRSEGTVIAKNNHIHELVKAERTEATCQAEGNTAYWTCTKCYKVFSDENGENQINIEDTVIAKAPHTVEILPGTHATSEHGGMTSGAICSVCHQVLEKQEEILKYEFTDVDLYSSTYGYEQLGLLTHGSEMQEMYKRLDAAATAYHNDTSLSITELPVIYYGDLGITRKEAQAAYSSFRMDNPLFYWIANTVAMDGTRFVILVDEDYYDGKTRQTYNNLIYTTVQKYGDIYDFDNLSAYETAMIFHDIIIDGMDYALTDKGEPEPSIWAHNVIGFFEYGSGVCECYAKTYNLLLNCYGVDNILVTGTAFNDGHAWNAVKSGEGEWYFCDLTLDDRPEYEFGKRYNYFFITDSQAISWADGSRTANISPMRTTHSVRKDSVDQSGTNYLYPLPQMASKVYNPNSVLLLKDRFSVDGIEYAVSGGLSVQIIGIYVDGCAEIPETVVYRGKTYTVTSIGQMVGTLFKSGAPIDASEDLTSIIIPKTVKFIWNKALDIPTLEYIQISPENEFYMCIDGIITLKQNQ